ncbi:MAG: hypothetical protein IJM19_00060 [Ruminococcus sp.]|nr:hypothetical protein [Ruminococcus sp.]
MSKKKHGCLTTIVVLFAIVGVTTVFKPKREKTENIAESSRISKVMEVEKTTEKSENNSTMEYSVADIPEVTETPTQPPTEPPTQPPTEPPTEAPPAVISPEFKDLMDSYEAFFDQYVEIVNRYAENPLDAEIMNEYFDYLNKLTEMEKNLNSIDQKSLNAAELAYYLEVTARIEAKLLKTAYSF